MIKWLKRLFSKQISSPPTKNLNGLYTARLEDIKVMYDDLKAKIDAIQVPSIPDHSNFAVKNAFNEWTNQNTYTNHSAPIVLKGDAERCINFKKNDGTTLLKVGKWNADNKAYVESTLDNLVLKVPTTKKTLIDSPETELRGPIRMGYGGLNAYIVPDDNTQGKDLNFKKDNMGHFNLNMNNTSKIKNLPNPTDNQDAATKNYVDSNAVTLNTTQTITGTKTFSNMTNMNNVGITGHVTGNTGQFDKINVTGNITESNQVTNKAYVDTQLGKIPSAIAVAPKRLVDREWKVIRNVWSKYSGELHMYQILGDASNIIETTTPWQNTLCIITIIFHQLQHPDRGDLWDSQSPKTLMIRTDANGIARVNFANISLYSYKDMVNNGSQMRVKYSIIAEPMQN